MQIISPQLSGVSGQERVKAASETVRLKCQTPPLALLSRRALLATRAQWPGPWLASGVIF
ncbi:hypothetical protein PCANC_03808 [Puccinia coronata f. sp. avenae]|uniref:Uncharacterized protein n=1 Tax=Puccinia coronata f. sp. avenae TaxID=200324 RepID=A0A2N5T7E9_9BASI|nr:hypothetical protein PCANC_03808 [Puccinia coronata f. sp. avenae]